MARRVGLIIPAVNSTVEEQMLRHYPRETVVHINRLRMTGPHKVPIDALVPRITEAAGGLADAGCEVVTFHCTANSTDEGPDGEARILQALAAAGLSHVSSTATAVRRALEALDARRIVLITPYSQAETDHEADFFRDIGIEVLTAIGHDLRVADYASAPPEFWLESALAARHDQADLYFLSCANINAMGVVDELERQLGRPVITSNQVVLWDQIAGSGLGLERNRRGACPGRLIAYA